MAKHRSIYRDSDSALMNGIVLDYETADRITLSVMQDHLIQLQQDVLQYEQHAKWMHEEDYRDAVEKYIPALKLLIAYFGGTV